MLKRLLISCLMIFALETFAQDPHFTQYNSAPLALNPALAGSTGAGRAMAGHRLQWPSIEGGYNTSIISYDQYLSGINSGAGLMYIHDITPDGRLTTDRIEMDYTYHMAVKIARQKFVIRPALSVAYMAKTMDFTGLTFGSQINPQTGVVSPSPYSGKKTKGNIDIGTGLLMYCKYVSGGFAVQHLTEPDEGIFGTSRLPRRYVFHIAGNIGAGDSAKGFAFSPHLLYMKQQNFYMVLAGGTVKYNNFLLGLAYRREDAFIVQAGFQSSLFRIGYSYDRTTSVLTNATLGSHELMFSFNILHKKDKKIEPLRTIAF